MTLTLFKSVSIAYTHSTKLYGNTYGSMITHARYLCQLLDPRMALCNITYTAGPFSRIQALPSQICILSVLYFVSSIEQGMPYARSITPLNWGGHDRDSASQESNSSDVELHACEGVDGCGFEKCSIKARGLGV